MSSQLGEEHRIARRASKRCWEARHRGRVNAQIKRSKQKWKERDPESFRAYIQRKNQNPHSAALRQERKRRDKVLLGDNYIRDLIAIRHGKAIRPHITPTMIAERRAEVVATRLRREFERTRLFFRMMSVGGALLKP